MSNFSQVRGITRGNYYWSESKLVALAVGVFCASYVSKNAQAMPFEVELIESQVVCEECSPIALENVNGELVTYAVPDSNPGTIQAYIGFNNDPIDILSEGVIFDPGTAQVSGGFLTVGNTTGQANSVFSLSQPGEAIDIPDIVSFETFPNLAAQFPTANLSLDVSSVNSSGQVAGEIASFVSPAVFDPATGVTENRSPFFLENNFPAGGFVEDISEDGNLLVGRGLNIQQFSNTGIPLFRATYIEGDEIVFISENESIAYHVGSTMFDASTILFEEDGVDNFFLPETGLTGSFGANFQIIDTLSLGFLVRETGSDSCYIGDSDGGLTEVGSNCVDGLFDGNELLLLEEGSSIIRTNLVTFEPGGSEVPEPATWLLLSVGLGFAACRRASRR